MGGLDKPKGSKSVNAVALSALLAVVQPSPDPHKPIEKPAGVNRLAREMDGPKIEKKDGKVVVYLTDPPPDKKDPEGLTNRDEV